MTTPGNPLTKRNLFRYAHALAMKTLPLSFLFVFGFLALSVPDTVAWAQKDKKPEAAKEEKAPESPKRGVEREKEAPEKEESKPRRESAERKEGPQGRPAPEIFRKIRELHEELAEANREKNPELAREIQEELKELYRKAGPQGRGLQGRGPVVVRPMAPRVVPNKMPMARPQEMRRPEPRPHHEEAEVRMHHLRVAAENLDRAGMRDQANELREQAEEIERDLHEQRERHHEREHGEPEGRGHLEAEIRELHEMVQDLRREVEELRDELNERGRGGRDRD